MPTEMTLQQKAEARAIVAELCKAAASLTLAADTPLDTRHDLAFAARLERLMPRVRALSQATSIDLAGITSGVAETTLGVEGLPLVQTGPGGEYTHLVRMEPPRVDYTGMQRWFRKLSAAVCGLSTKTGTHIDVKA